jgi:hypothetical protein
MAKSSKSAKSITNGKKVGRISKSERNVAATEKAGVRTRQVMSGQQVGEVAVSGQQSKPVRGKKAAAKAAPAKKGGKSNGASVQQGQRGRVSEFPVDMKVKATTEYEPREGSFAAKIMALATKPTTIGAIIDQATAKRKEYFRNSVCAESADAARRSITIRVRSLLRSEWLLPTK